MKSKLQTILVFTNVTYRGTVEQIFQITVYHESFNVTVPLCSILLLICACLTVIECMQDVDTFTLKSSQLRHHSSSSWSPLPPHVSSSGLTASLTGETDLSSSADIVHYTSINWPDVYDDDLYNYTSTASCTSSTHLFLKASSVNCTNGFYMGSWWNGHYFCTIETIVSKYWFSSHASVH